MSEIQSVEGRPVKKGMSPGRTSGVSAAILLVGAVGVFVVGSLLRPAPIPADHVLALVDAKGNVVLAKEDGSSPLTLPGSGIPKNATRVWWVPGGDFIALGSGTELTVADREGVVAWRHALTWAADVAWSPDGSRIAIYDGTVNEGSVTSMDATIEVLTSTGELQWKVPLPDDFGFVARDGKLSWAPNGESFVFTGSGTIDSGRQTSELWQADLGRQAFRSIAASPRLSLEGVAWASDGTLYVAGVEQPGATIWTVDPAKGAPVPIFQRPGPEGFGPIVPSPDGRAIAFRDPDTGLSILVPSTRRRIPVADLNAGAAAWTRDAAAMLYLRQAAAGPDAALPSAVLRFEIGSLTSTMVASDVLAFDLLSAAP